MFDTKLVAGTTDPQPLDQQQQLLLSSLETGIQMLNHLRSEALRAPRILRFVGQIERVVDVTTQECLARGLFYEVAALKRLGPPMSRSV